MSFLGEALSHTLRRPAHHKHATMGAEGATPVPAPVALAVVPTGAPGAVSFSSLTPLQQTAVAGTVGIVGLSGLGTGLVVGGLTGWLLTRKWK